MQTKEVMTSSEAAQYLQVHKNTLYKLTKSGEIPAKKVGRQWRYHKDALDQWLMQADDHLA